MIKKVFLGILSVSNFQALWVKSDLPQSAQRRIFHLVKQLNPDSLEENTVQKKQESDKDQENCIYPLYFSRDSATLFCTTENPESSHIFSYITEAPGETHNSNIPERLSAIDRCAIDLITAGSITLLFHGLPWLYEKIKPKKTYKPKIYARL